MSSLIAEVATVVSATAAHSADWHDAAPPRHVGTLPATPGFCPRPAIHYPLLVLGLLCLVVFVLYVQAVQLSLMRGEAFQQARVASELARVAEAAALRDTPRVPGWRMLQATVAP